MPIAVASVGGSPIARIVYGTVTATPSTAMPVSAAVKLESRPIRTPPTWIASAPAGAQLLDRVEQVLGGQPVVGVGDRQHDARALGGDGAGEDAERVGARARLLQGGARRVAGGRQPGAAGLQVGDLPAQPVLREDRSSRIRTRSSCRAAGSPLVDVLLRT
jgi:hypothetical protein